MSTRSGRTKFGLVVGYDQVVNVRSDAGEFRFVVRKGGEGKARLLFDTPPGFRVVRGDMRQRLGRPEPDRAA